MQIHHLALRTDHVAALATFYCEAFALPRIHETSQQSVWLSIETGAVMMIEKRRDGEPKPASNSLELVAFAATTEEKERVRAFAQANDCYDGETEHTVYLRDPEGRRVAVSTYPLPNAPKSSPADEAPK